MSFIAKIKEGHTGEMSFTLLDDGVAYDYTGIGVDVVLTDCHETVLFDTSSGVSTVGSTDGTVSWTPPSTTVMLASKSPYRISFRLTDASTEIVYYPSEDEALIQVRKP